MRIPLPPEIQPTNEMLTLIAAIDEFKGEWRALGNLEAESLQSLRRIATIEAVDSVLLAGAQIASQAAPGTPGKARYFDGRHFSS